QHGRRTRLSTTQISGFRLSLTFRPSGGHEPHGAFVRTLRRQGPIETGARARMAGHAVAFDVAPEPQNVLVAVRSDFANAQEVAALLALLPDALPRARPEVRQSSLNRERQGLGVHPGEHEGL